MEVIVRKHDPMKRWSGKLDGEFRAPLEHGKGSHKHKWLCCLKCNEPHALSVNTFNFICRKCNIVNVDMDACEKLFAHLDAIGKLFNESSAHILTEGAKAYVNLRDKQQIKAHLYAKGIRRNTVGGDRYRRILDRTLKEHHVK